MADLHYYVDIIHGSDTNDGLSSSMSWATITKAVQTVTANPNGNTFVHIAPGIYREKPTLVSGGTDSTHRIIFQGDPECIYFPNSHSGPIRITGTNISEKATTGNIISFGSITYVEFWNVQIDGVSDYAVISSGAPGQILRKCTILSNSCVSNVTCYDCTLYCSSVNTSFAAVNASIIYNTMLIGCGIIYASTSYNCLTLGGSFYGGTAYNCIGLGGDKSFISVNNYNNYAAFSRYGFYGGKCNSCLYHNCPNQEAMTGLTRTGSALYNTKIHQWLSTGLVDKGTLGSSVTFPTNDFLGKKRIQNSAIDIGPLEITNYILDWDNYNVNPPGIKIAGEGQCLLKFPVEANVPIVKSVWMKHVNTTIQPQIIIQGLGQTYTSACSSPDETWEQVFIYFISEKKGIMDLILHARDPAASAYTIFSDPS